MQKVLDRTKKQNNEIKKITSIDFNCDLAQGFGIYRNDKEFDLLDWVSSVNISTGFHAGDPLNIKNALLKAKEKNIVIGAHIGFRDIEGFGHRMMNLSEEEIEATVVYQVGAIMSFAKAYGLEVEHVRPHGAMYKLAGENFSFACAVARAIKKCSQWLVYYGAAGDITEKVGEFIKIPVAHEIRLDRNYNVNGSIDYSTDGIINTEFSIRRLQNLLKASQIDNNKNGQTVIKADTIHFSSRVANSIELLKRANEIIEPIPVNYNKVKDSGWV
ncbi:MAG TPA: LamB/YcsF family protein [Candidatus Gastranaerophilaceae bacterium]|nr:LamB/YcsF family protein [Candidatus Gastranaerophilaceae bacterium]HPT42030.1 LamB/YcsF family protein [Candidatus Gastranaerophilaceae bacterium]